MSLGWRFSWELPGSIASLLGRGVRLTERFAVAIELDLVVSWRQGDEATFLSADDGAGLLAMPPPPDLEKNPRILCCLPVEGAWPTFLAIDGVLAGVRAGVDFSPILG